MPVLTILKFVWGYWREFAFAGILLVMLFMKLDISHLNNIIDAQKNTIAQFQTVNRQLNGQIKDQNASIDTLKKTGDDYLKQIEDGKNQSAKDKQSYEATLAKLRSKPMPKTCSGVMDRLLDDALTNKGGSHE